MSRPRAPRRTLLGAIAWRISSVFRAAAFGQALPPWDDYFYQGHGFDSAAGMNVSPETAMRLSAVFACVRVRSETFGACPAVICRRYPDGREELAPEHPLYNLLRYRPNPWQTSMEFFEMQQAHQDLRGNAFAHIVSAPGAAIDQLIPIHPDLVQVLRLPNGRLKYQVRSRYQAEVNYYTQDEIFHMRGLSSDGLVGLSTIALQREMLGRGLAMQDSGARGIANDSRPPGYIKHPARFRDDEARQKFKQSYQDSQTGANRGKTPLFEEGMEYVALGMSNVDSQFIEASKLNREEIAGIFRVPPHKIGILERSTNNNIEHQGIEFVTDCMHPIAARWEARINSDLIEPLGIPTQDGAEYFVKFKLDGLLRGDLKSRYDAYAVGHNGGWLSPNDICQMENRNPIPPDKGGDDYLRPVNYTVAGAVAPQPGAPAPGAQGDDPPPDNSDSADPSQDTPAARSTLLRNVESAIHLVRKEVTVLRKLLAENPRAFKREAADFYDAHATLVARRMCIPEAAAKEYLGAHAKLLGDVADDSDRVSVLDWIGDTGAAALADVALAGKCQVALIGGRKNNEI